VCHRVPGEVVDKPASIVQHNLFQLLPNPKHKTNPPGEKKVKSTWSIPLHLQ
jgi:hypothetical protein